MTTDEKVEAKLSAKEACYKLRVLDVQQERRLLVIQEKMRIIESQPVKLKPRVPHFPSYTGSYYTEDTADHARTLRLGERVTSTNPDLEWDKDFDSFDYDNAETETNVDSIGLLEFTGESEEGILGLGKTSTFLNNSLHDSYISCVEKAELQSAYNLEFVLCAVKKLTMENFVRYANLADDEVGMWTGPVENSSFFKNYNTVKLDIAQDEAIEYMARKSMVDINLHTKEINAIFHAEDRRGVHALFKESEECTTTTSEAIKAKVNGFNAQLTELEESCNAGAVMHNTQEEPHMVDQFLSQLNVNDSGPKTISQQIEESQTRFDIGHTGAFNSVGPSENRVVNGPKGSVEVQPDISAGEICKVCRCLDCTDLICWF